MSQTGDNTVCIHRPDPVVNITKDMNITTVPLCAEFSDPTFEVHWFMGREQLDLTEYMNFEMHCADIPVNLSYNSFRVNACIFKTTIKSCCLGTLIKKYNV